PRALRAGWAVNHLSPYVSRRDLRRNPRHRPGTLDRDRSRNFALCHSVHRQNGYCLASHASFLRLRCGPNLISHNVDKAEPAHAIIDRADFARKAKSFSAYSKRPNSRSRNSQAPATTRIKRMVIPPTRIRVVSAASAWITRPSRKLTRPKNAAEIAV